LGQDGRALRRPGYWNGSAIGELEKRRAEVRQLRAAVDWRDRRIGDLELRLRGAPAPSTKAKADPVAT
jgi:hypothetical protein